MYRYFNVYDSIKSYNNYTGSVKFNKDDLNKSTLVFDLIFKLFYNNYNKKDFNLIISYFYEVIARVFFLEKSLSICYLKVQSDLFSIISNLDNEKNVSKFENFVLNWRTNYGIKLGITILI